MRSLLYGVGVAAVLVAARPAQAQDGKGFLFEPPFGSVTLRGGFDRANASSDIFSFTTTNLSVNRGDFSSPVWALDVGFRLTPRVDLVLGAGASSRSIDSDFRHLIGTDNVPIRQTTKFQRVPVTLSAKYYLTPRDRSIGRFAWIPARFAPFVGVGGGAMWYRFNQAGEFVDQETNDIFRDEFNSSSWTGTAHALAGFDYSLSTRWLLTAEGRYTYASAPMSNDFGNFNHIDLSGFQITAGVGVRF
jgi:outer membrane protein W